MLDGESATPAGKLKPAFVPSPSVDPGVEPPAPPPASVDTAPAGVTASTTWPERSDANIVPPAVMAGPHKFPYAPIAPTSVVAAPAGPAKLFTPSVLSTTTATPSPSPMPCGCEKPELASATVPSGAILRALPLPYSATKTAPLRLTTSDVG